MPLDKPEKWAKINWVHFSKDKCKKTISERTINQTHKLPKGSDWLGCNAAKKAPGIIVDVNEHHLHSVLATALQKACGQTEKA